MRKHSKQFPGATPYFDRHGVRRWRFRRKGFSAELGADYGSPDFIARYEAAQKHQRLEGGAGRDRTRPGSINAMVVAFYASPGFRNLAARTRRSYSGIIERFRRVHGDKRVSQMQRRHVLEVMADKADTPAAANELLRMLRMLMEHAIALEMRTDNPTTGVKRFKIAPDGFHTWTEDEIARYYEVHPLGTLAHLAMTLMLRTGASAVDAVALGWGNIKDGRISYRRTKTRRHSDLVVDLQIHPDLMAALELLPRDSFTFLQTRLSKSRSASGLSTLMRGWCDSAGLPECTTHGLRKACARRLAEAGATPNMIAAVTGHTTLAEVSRYTRAASRSGLAGAAFAMEANQEQVVTNHPKRFVNNNGKQLSRKRK
jgi:integrase